jgi:hypothetical protein
MSCDHRFTTFITTAAQVSAIAQALGGDPATAVAVLSELLDVTREQAGTGRGRLTELRAQAGCTALFERMGCAGVTPTVHGEPAPGKDFSLPADSATRHAYAAIEATIAAADAGEPLPARAREIATAVAYRNGRPAPPPLRRFDRLFHVRA